MSDNAPKNNSSGSNENSQPENDRPLGKLSDFRGNMDSSGASQNDEAPVRQPDSPEQALPEKPPDQYRPQAGSSQQESGFERKSVPNTPPHAGQHSAGTGMYWAAALIALALLTLFFNNRLESKQHSEGITEKLLQQADGHYYARGQINNQPVLFIVDTGASVVSIPATLADSMGLPRLEPERVNTANGEITVFNTRPVTIRLGDIQLYDVEAHINPGMEPPGVLLGMSFYDGWISASATLG